MFGTLASLVASRVVEIFNKVIIQSFILFIVKFDFSMNLLIKSKKTIMEFSKNSNKKK